MDGYGYADMHKM